MPSCRLPLKETLLTLSFPPDSLSQEPFCSRFLTDSLSYWRPLADSSLFCLFSSTGRRRTRSRDASHRVRSSPKAPSGLMVWLPYAGQAYGGNCVFLGWLYRSSLVWCIFASFFSSSSLFHSLSSCSPELSPFTILRSRKWTVFNLPFLSLTVSLPYLHRYCTRACDSSISIYTKNRRWIKRLINNTSNASVVNEPFRVVSGKNPPKAQWARDKYVRICIMCENIHKQICINILYIYIKITTWD